MDSVKNVVSACHLALVRYWFCVFWDEGAFVQMKVRGKTGAVTDTSRSGVEERGRPAADSVPFTINPLASPYSLWEHDEADSASSAYTIKQDEGVTRRDPRRTDSGDTLTTVSKHSETQTSTEGHDTKGLLFQEGCWAIAKKRDKGKLIWIWIIVKSCPLLIMIFPNRN